MKEKVIADTIQQGVSTNTIEKIDATAESTINIWLWIAIIELIVILYLLFFKASKNNSNKKQQFKEEAMKSNVDFSNIINSSFNVEPLYKELKMKCHPDRFPTDSEKNKIAVDLFQEISRNKTDFKKLQQLKETAITQLNIKF